MNNRNVWLFWFAVELILRTLNNTGSCRMPRTVMLKIY